MPLRAPRKKLLRHKISGRQFGRASGPRKAMFRIMVTDLLRHGQIKTTVAKAKAIRPLTEKMVTLGKAGTLHDRRQAAAFITDKSVLKAVFWYLIDVFCDFLSLSIYTTCPLDLF